MNSHRGRFTIFFVSLTAMIVLVNTPVPRWLLGALFGEVVGNSVGASLRGFTRDLFLLLLVSLYFEWVRSRTSARTLLAIEQDVTDLKEAVRELIPANMKRLALDSADPKEMAQLAVRRLFGYDHGIDTVVSQLAPAKQPYNEVSVELRVLRVSDEVASVFMSVSLEAELGDISLGVTKKAEHTSALVKSKFDFFDVISVPQDRDFNAIKASLRAHLKLYHRDGSGRFNEVEFEAVKRSAQTALLKPPAGMTHDDFVIFRVPETTPLRGREKVRAEYYFDMDLSEHFVYWFADRPMFLRQMTIDVHEVAAHLGKLVRFQVFMGDSDSIAVDVRDARLSLKVDRWILDGHGVAAVW